MWYTIIVMGGITENPARKRCQAMIDAGIEDPDSREGARFCTDKCPYDFCIVFEGAAADRQTRTREMVKKTMELLRAGYGKREIGRRLHRHPSTIKYYIKLGKAE
ncbi:unnamed protein product [marine sediment metagenome]|uniref:Transposase IS30-like HTH domain-containing protein n=1 Tax=marine sediment metagenome TaxID=412755 RepID=X1CKY8_9ZZZZ